MSKVSENGFETIFIKPQTGWQILNLKELREYRDLLFFLVWRDIKVLYAQTILGFSWAILQPLIQIVLFTIVFGKVAKVPTDGIPYFLFSTVAIIPWNYMSQAMTHSSISLVNQQHMLGKIYFPRLIYPLVPVLSRFMDFGISFLILVIVLLYYRVNLSFSFFFFPVFIILMTFISAGIGLWLSSMAIRFRDVKYAMEFVVRLMMYSAPIVYSSTSIPEKYRFLYSLNPLVAVIEGFRCCLLGTPVPWTIIWPGIVTTFLILLSGAFYFKRMEVIIVDVI